MNPFGTGIDLRQAFSLVTAGRIAEAESIAIRAGAQSKKNPRFFALLGQIAEAKGHLEEAAKHYQKSITLDSQQMMTHIALGQVRTSQGRFKDAITSLHKALKFQPNHSNAIAALADAYDKQGDPDSALRTIQPFIDRHDETPHMAVVYATVCMNRQQHDEAIRTASRHLDNENLDLNNRQLLGFVRGRALESLGRYDEAFEAYQQANAAILTNFDETSHRRKIDDLIDVFSARHLKALPRSTGGSELPIFIAGMPRSG
ncbi:MAG: tetratricopeptide repeat protein, partial [Planctomycetes bacterium]|nr:tetratricopeptide repeat protein [Planctomycetota bacterium]